MDNRVHIEGYIRKQIRDSLSDEMLIGKTREQATEDIINELYEKNQEFMLKTIFRQSIIKYGKEPQCRQAMEECAELIQAINKRIRYPDRKDCHDNLIEEICDVEIMLYQLKIMFDISDDEVFNTKVQKAKREQERLKRL